MTYEEAIRAHDVADYCELIVRKANKQSKRGGGMPKKLPPSNK